MIELIHLPPEYHPPIDEMPGDLKRVAEAIEAGIPGMGVRITLLLAQIPGIRSNPVYFRSVDNLIRRWRDDQMRAEYDAGLITAKELAAKVRLSLRQTENILGKPDTQDELKKKQLKLFDVGREKKEVVSQ